MARGKLNGKIVENTLEQAIIELFKEEGYEYIYGDNIHRKPEDVLLTDDLRNYLLARYASRCLTDSEIQKIIDKINLISASSLYEGNRETFRLINEGFDFVRDDSTKAAFHVDYINYDEPDENVFKVVNQYSVKDIGPRVPDILVFINGIPVSIFELKNPATENTTIKDAWEQIYIRYRRDIPKLLKYCFMSVISDGANTRLGTIFTSLQYYYAWNKIDAGVKSRGLDSLHTMMKGAFTKERLVAILRDFVFYPDDSSKEEAIVCRYPQFYAANKMLGNIKKHMRPDGDGKGGTYFGAMGCGKTYTMMFLARMLIKRDNKAFGNPTILLITDRDNLDSQTSEIFVSAKLFLGEKDVKSIENRADLEKTLRDKPSGGVYITTIQKFCEETGLLSIRNNIICMADEAHRSQTEVVEKTKKTENGIRKSIGFGKCLHDSFPNATYCGFTGTPIDKTIAVFGPIVDSYTMKESSDDGITVRIAYEQRITRVALSDKEIEKIKKYYERAVKDGASQKDVEDSEKAMTKLSELLKDPERIKRLADDIVTHYETLCDQKPGVVQKAMIVCSSRQGALDLIKAILKIRPEWGEKHRAENERDLPPDRLNNLLELPKINLVATQGVNDNKELYDTCGSAEYRKTLDKQFKNDDSNFKIAVVVDMWITGFDVPSLSVMYIDKPIQKHTLVQTISRVNRVYEGKSKGLVVDYIDIKKEMLEAMKMYEGIDESPVDEISVSVEIFRNELSSLDGMFNKFDARKFFCGSSVERLDCLNMAAEYIQIIPSVEKHFMDTALRLRLAFDICRPSGMLTEEEVTKANFYISIRSIIRKESDGSGDVPTVERMNADVEKMIHDALVFSDVEPVMATGEVIDIFSDEYVAALEKIKLPISKFNTLLARVRGMVSDYARLNIVKAVDFEKRIKDIVDRYNSRDSIVPDVNDLNEFIKGLTGELEVLIHDVRDDSKELEKLGISYEEKAYYDILVRARDEQGFTYSDKKCIDLAKKINSKVGEISQYVDWSSRDETRYTLIRDIKMIFHSNEYYKVKGETGFYDEVIKTVISQAENIRRYAA